MDNKVSKEELILRSFIRESISTDLDEADATSARGYKDINSVSDLNTFVNGKLDQIRDMPISIKFTGDKTTEYIPFRVKVVDDNLCLIVKGTPTNPTETPSEAGGLVPGVDGVKLQGPKATQGADVTAGRRPRSTAPKANR